MTATKSKSQVFKIRAAAALEVIILITLLPLGKFIVVCNNFADFFCHLIANFAI